MSKVLDDVSTLTGEVEKLKRENEALKQALKVATKPDYATIAREAWFSGNCSKDQERWKRAATAVINAYNKHEASL